MSDLSFSLQNLIIAGVAFVLLRKHFTGSLAATAQEETFEPLQPDPHNRAQLQGDSAVTLDNVKFPVSRINPPRYNERLEKGSM